MNDINTGPTCSPEEYLDGDNLPVCDDSDATDADWDNQFMAEINPNQLDLGTQEDNDDDDSFDLQPPGSKYSTYQEAITALEDVQAFLDCKGHSELATTVGAQIDSVMRLNSASMSSARQSTIDEYFI